VDIVKDKKAINKWKNKDRNSGKEMRERKREE
jgi:hypothetical protein